MALIKRSRSTALCFQNCTSRKTWKKKNRTKDHRTLTKIWQSRILREVQLHPCRRQKTHTACLPVFLVQQISLDSLIRKHHVVSTWSLQKVYSLFPPLRYALPSYKEPLQPAEPAAALCQLAALPCSVGAPPGPAQAFPGMEQSLLPSTALNLTPGTTRTSSRLLPSYPVQTRRASCSTSATNWRETMLCTTSHGCSLHYLQKISNIHVCI